MRRELVERVLDLARRTGVLLEYGSPVEIEDVIKSLNSLIKYNGGLWKSEKQARFLLNRVSGSAFKDRPAEEFARRNHLKGYAFSHMSALKGYGHRDPSKIRYTGMVFVVDQGGVVYRGKVKVIHPKQGRGLGLDWNDVKATFRRERKPEIAVDPEAEFRAQVAKNQPDIDAIKSIPNWAEHDILVSFLRQLEQGHSLSLKQRAVIQRMAPDKTDFSANKREWADLLKRFKGLVAFKIYTPLKLAFQEKFADHEGSDESDDPFANFDGKGETRGEWYARMVSDYGQAVREASKGNFSASSQVHWVHHEAAWKLFHMFSRGATPEYGIDSFEEILQQMERAIKAKTPSKKSLGVVAFVDRVVQGLTNSSSEQMVNRFIQDLK